MDRYVGELGYELYVPAEQAVHVYDRIVNAGSDPDVGLRHAGLKALSSLRMEKAYRDYGHDMDNTDTLLEVHLLPNAFTALTEAHTDICSSCIICIFIFNIL